MAKFVVNRAGMDFVLKNPEGLVGKDLLKRGRKLRSLARAQVGKDTLALHNSMNYRLATKYGSLTVMVGSDNKVALMHHKGTRPHIILPKHASTLRFYSHGRIVYAKVVHHPGTRPNRYLTDNLPKVV